jgi:pimeloyl-ACP methyl ester carboxylesterase
MQPETISLGSSTIAYRESPGAGTPIVLIHGNSCSGQAFERQFASSIADKYRLVALDLPGHGDSSPAMDPDTAYSLRGYAETLVQFVDRRGLQAAIFVGWSLGGHIVLQAAEQLDRALGFMVFGTPPLARPFAPAECFLPHEGSSHLFTESLAEAERRSFAALMFRSEGAVIPESFLADIQRTHPLARSRLLSKLLTEEFEDEVAIVERLPAPLAVLHGEHDQLVNAGYVRALSRFEIWRGSAQIIPDAGHAPQWENPESFNALLEDFIQECLRRKTASAG